MTDPVHVHVHLHTHPDPKVGEILTVVRHIETQGETIMATEAELGAALAQLGTDVAEVKTDLAAAVARVEAAAAAAGVDLTDELGAVRNASAGLDDVSTALQGLAPEAPPEA